MYCYPPPTIPEEEFNILEERLAAISGSTKKKTEASTPLATEIGEGEITDLDFTEDFQVGTEEGI